MSIRRFIFLITITLVFLFIVSYASDDGKTKLKIFAQSDLSHLSNKSIQKLWETQTQLKNPESIVYDTNNDILYVSNVDGKPDEKDNKGFISKVSPSNGDIIELKWISNLNAPKGVDVNTNTNKLYVSDLSELIEANISNGEITNRYLAQQQNSFLNDVVVDNQGNNVFVSDSQNNAIYKLSIGNSDGNNSLQIWLQSDELNGPNGLLIDSKKNSLIVASMGKGTAEMGGTIKAVDLNNKTIYNLGKDDGKKVPIGILDGVEADAEEKNYYVSDWTTKNIHVVDSNGNGYYQLQDRQTQGTADLELIDAKNIIIVPLMQENKLVAFNVSP